MYQRNPPSRPIPIPNGHTAPARLHLRKHIVIGYEGPDELYHDESEELSSLSSCDYILVGSPPDIEDLGHWLSQKDSKLAELPKTAPSSLKAERFPPHAKPIDPLQNKE